MRGGVGFSATTMRRVIYCLPSPDSPPSKPPHSGLVICRWPYNLDVAGQVNCCWPSPAQYSWFWALKDAWSYFSASWLWLLALFTYFVPNWLQNTVSKISSTTVCVFTSLEMCLNKPLYSNWHLHNGSLTPQFRLLGIASQYVQFEWLKELGFHKQCITTHQKKKRLHTRCRVTNHLLKAGVLLITLVACLETGLNTSTTALGVIRGDEKGIQCPGV